MITLEEVLGYFPDGESIYLGAIYPTLHCCKECYATVLSVHREDHIRWHKGTPRTDKEMLSTEIQDAAKRELGRLRESRLTVEQKIRDEILAHETKIGNPYPELWDEGCH